MTISGPARAEISVPEIEQLFAEEQLRLSRSEVPFATKVITIFYLVVAVFHVLLLEGVLRWTMFPLALLTTMLGAAVWRYCARNPQLDERQVFLIQCLLSGAALLNGFVHLGVSGEIRETVNILVIFIFLVYLRPPVVMFFSLLTGSTILWLFTILITQPGSPEFVHYTFAVFMTSAVASLIYMNTRSLTYAGIHGFRQRLVLEHRLKFANQRLSELAMVDPLTGIANRRSFETFFDKLCKRAAGGSTLRTMRSKWWGRMPRWLVVARSHPPGARQAAASSTSRP